MDTFLVIMCLDEGVSISRRMIYLPSEQHLSRTHASIQMCSQEAESTGKPVDGIKGMSILSDHIDLVNGLPIDYMHGVLEGVTKVIMKFWFDSQYSNKSFSLCKFVDQIDRKLVSVRPPHEFRRSPRSIVSTQKFWKASEYRAWLLFYAVPIACPYLPPEYAHHFLLL